MPHTHTHTYRANVVRLCPDTEDDGDLRAMARRVSALWNVANYECRQAFLRKEGVPGYSKLCRIVKGHPVYRSLPSDVAQEALTKLAEAWASYWKLRKKWADGELEDKPGLPRYRKDRKTGEYREDFIPIKKPRSYSVDPETVSVTLPYDLRSTRGGGRLEVPYRGLRRYVGDGGRGEFRFDRGRRRWYFRWAVAVAKPKDWPWQRAAGIDLGVRVLASVSVEGDPVAKNYSGREVLRDWDYWGRRIAEHQRELAHRGKKGSARLSRLHQKRRGRLVHAWEAAGRRIVGHLERERVGVVYIGHPKHIRRDRTYSGVWSGRIHNFWSFHLAISILKKHLARAGIRTVVVGERETSTTCPECGSQEVIRSPRTWLSCRACGLRIHSDQAASRNLINQNRPSACWDGLEASPRTETQRWTKHYWVDSVNQSGSVALPGAA